MIDVDKFDIFKNEFLGLLKGRYQHKFDMDDLYLEEDYSIKESLEYSCKNLNLTMELFIRAKEAGDLLAMSVALVRVHVFMHDIYGVFSSSMDDVKLFMRLSDDIVIPEDYKIPEHYNYPLK